MAGRTIPDASNNSKFKRRLPPELQARRKPQSQSVRAQDSLVEVFNKLGGIEGMTKWAKKNPTEFYRLWARLLPVQTEVKADITFEIVRAKADEFTRRIVEISATASAGSLDGRAGREDESSSAVPLALLGTPKSASS